MNPLRLAASALVLLGLLSPARADETTTLAEPSEAATRLDVGVQLHTRWELELEEDRTGNEFRIALARLRFNWRHDDWLRAKLQADVDQLFGDGDAGDDATAMVRDAWVEGRLHKSLRVRMGQFKRPFSRLELRSRGDLETIRRGIGNGLLIEDFGYGDRDLGLQLSGRFGKRKKQRLDYALGIFNGTGRNAPETDRNGAKDLVARLEARPIKPLSVGINGSLKLFDTDSVPYVPSYAWAAGIDGALRLGRLRLLAEGLVGLNWDKCVYADDPADCREENDRADVPYAWSATVMASYRFPLWEAWKLALEPVLKAEVLVPDHTLDDGRIYLATAGINLHVARRLRLMVHLEEQFPEAGAPEDWERQGRFWIQAAFGL
jgi:hypothetical protein